MAKSTDYVGKASGNSHANAADKKLSDPQNALIDKNVPSAAETKKNNKKARKAKKNAALKNSQTDSVDKSGHASAESDSDGRHTPTIDHKAVNFAAVANISSESDIKDSGFTVYSEEPHKVHSIAINKTVADTTAAHIPAISQISGKSMGSTKVSTEIQNEWPEPKDAPPEKTDPLTQGHSHDEPVSSEKRAQTSKNVNQTKQQARFSSPSPVSRASKAKSTEASNTLPKSQQAEIEQSKKTEENVADKQASVQPSETSSTNRNQQAKTPSTKAKPSNGEKPSIENNGNKSAEKQPTHLDSGTEEGSIKEQSHPSMTQIKDSHKESSNKNGNESNAASSPMNVQTKVETPKANGGNRKKDDIVSPEEHAAKQTQVGSVTEASPFVSESEASDESPVVQKTLCENEKTKIEGVQNRSLSWRASVYNNVSDRILCMIKPILKATLGYAKPLVSYSIVRVILVAVVSAMAVPLAMVALISSPILAMSALMWRIAIPLRMKSQVKGTISHVQSDVKDAWRAA